MRLSEVQYNPKYNINASPKQRNMIKIFSLSKQFCSYQFQQQKYREAYQKTVTLKKIPVF